MKRFDRLNAILLLLQTRRSVTAAFLAEHFSVSERTIYRDMRSLQTAGVLVEGEAGVGYFLPPDYRLPPVMFSEQEATALVLAARAAGGMLDTGLQDALSGAVLKMRSVLPAPVNAHLEALLETVAVHTPGLRGEVLWLSRLQKMVARRLVASIRYETAAGATSREVEPVGLLFYSGQWHFIGWCRLRSDFRDFRVDRILSLDETGEVLHGSPRIGLEGYLKKMREELRFSEAGIRFTPEAWARFSTDRSMSGLIHHETAADGQIEARLYLWDTASMARWLVSYGGGAVPLDPPELVAAFFGLADGISALRRPD